MFGSTIKLDKELIARVKKFSDIAGYSSPREFITHAVEKELAKLEDAGSEEEIPYLSLIIINTEGPVATRGCRTRRQRCDRRATEACLSMARTRLSVTTSRGSRTGLPVSRQNISAREVKGLRSVHHGRRHILHFNATFHPTAAWVIQQSREEAVLIVVSTQRLRHLALQRILKHHLSFPTGRSPRDSSPQIPVVPRTA